MSELVSATVPSKALEYVTGKAWKFKDNGEEIILEYCPFKRCDNFHFYLNKITGLWLCHKCSEAGNLNKLMGSQGDRPVAGVTSVREGQSKDREEIPNVHVCHAALMADEEAIDYLVCDRGFKMEVIERQKLGLCMRAFKDTGWKEVKTLCIPHLYQGNVVWMKFRTIPPAPKAYDSPRHWDATLYNEEVIVKDMDELILVEGEADTISLLSNGVDYVCGVPGANIKKADWIMKLDEMKVKKIYILYDSDKVGQKAAQELAQRIGLDHCFKLVLPPFNKADGTDGKDVNEWFQAGHTLEEFEQLKQDAKAFDVVGVLSTVNALEDLKEEIRTGGSKPKYQTPWKALDGKLGGFNPGDVIDIIAEGKIGKTTLLLNILEYLVATYDESAFLYCLEMPQSRMARKWASHVTQTDDSPETGKMSTEVIDQAINLSRSREAELLFGYTPAKDPEDVYSVIRQTVRRYNIKFAGFDNLQLLCDKTLRNQNTRTVHLSQISKNLKDLAMELGLVLFRIIQPNKVANGEIVSARNADGASQIEKDCDAMIAAHRNRKAQMKKQDSEMAGFVDEVEAFDPKMFLRVDLSRYAPGGTTTLWFDGATSTVREFDKQEVAAVPKGPQLGFASADKPPVEA